MDFLNELKWRGMLHDMTPGLDEVMQSKKITAYIGFDPTASSLGIGNYVQIMLLRLLQLSGHHPIILLGGATGRIGDPSGKDKERTLKTYEELDQNLENFKLQFHKYLAFDGVENPARIINNHDFYREMNVLEFLRNVGKTLTVNYMMTKESVKKRIETGISFTEFSYQLLQAYDFQCLYEQENCILQMGGSDQWGNITSGTEFIRRNLSGKAYAVTTPLLTRADGRKFGKSESGNIYLDAAMTSPYKFYQFWINADDADISSFTRYFTLKSQEEVEAAEKEFADNPRALKQQLAEELTVRIHSPAVYQSVLKVSELLFNKKVNKDTLLDMKADELSIVAGEIPTFTVAKETLSNGVNVVDLLTEKTQVLDSKGNARKAIKNNAVSINKEKVGSHELSINHEALLHGKYLMVENGKKNKFILIAE